MLPTMKDFGIDRLSTAEKIALAQEIWESVAPDVPVPSPTPEQIEELMRRDDELEAHPESALTWEQIKQGIKGSL